MSCPKDLSFDYIWIQPAFTLSERNTFVSNAPYADIATLKAALNTGYKEIIGSSTDLVSEGAKIEFSEGDALNTANLKKKLRNYPGLFEAISHNASLWDDLDTLLNDCADVDVIILDDVKDYMFCVWDFAGSALPSLTAGQPFATNVKLDRKASTVNYDAGDSGGHYTLVTNART